jgi:hypothetical protein
MSMRGAARTLLSKVAVVINLEEFTLIYTNNKTDFRGYLEQALAVVCDNIPELKGYQFPGVTLELVEEVTAMAHHGAHMFKRHGQQDSTKSKIEQMMLPDNLEDPITLDSAKRFIPELLLAKFLAYQGIHFRVRSSPNRRALIPAEALADVVGINLEVVVQIQCPIYLPEEKRKPGALNPNGSVSYTKEAIDGACGEGTFDEIEENTEEYVSYSTAEKGELIVTLGHTQHNVKFNKMLKEQGLVSVVAERLGNYGFLLTTKDKAMICASGLQTESAVYKATMAQQVVVGQGSLFPRNTEEALAMHSAKLTL